MRDLCLRKCVTQHTAGMILRHHDDGSCAKCDFRLLWHSLFMCIYIFINDPASTLYPHSSHIHISSLEVRNLMLSTQHYWLMDTSPFCVRRSAFTICIYDLARGLTPNEHLLAHSEFELHMEYI